MQAPAGQQFPGEGLRLRGSHERHKSGYTFSLQENSPDGNILTGVGPGGGPAPSPDEDRWLHRMIPMDVVPKNQFV
jgi:hypothetical protein